MQEDQIVLHFEVAPDRYPNTTVAARALIEWVDLVQSTIAAIDPLQRLNIEIVGVTPGSTRFPQLLRFLDKQAGNVRSAWDDYPHLKSIVAGSAHTLYTAAIAGAVSMSMQPSVQLVQLSEKDRHLFEGIQKQASQSRPVVQASKRFYGALEQDTAITGVGVADAWDKRPSIIIPRSEFAERSGLWDVDVEIAPSERFQRVVWDVVLRRPDLVSTPQLWQFMRDGLKFSAKMHDAIFLAAMRDGRIPLTLQEGVMMKVEIEYKERLTGQVWEPVKGSWRVVKVLSPVPSR